MSEVAPPATIRSHILSRATYEREAPADSPGVGEPTRRLRYTAPTVPIAAVAFDFDPLLRLPADLVVRWQTVALAAVIAAALLAAGAAAHRTGLRADDLLYVAIGVVPGAVLAGRLGYGLVHADAFAVDPLRLLDPSAPGADLGAAVVGGLVTGSYVVMLLGAPLGRWAGAAALPLLFALGAGKLAMVLGGSGQGLPSDVAWATAYVGPGPWGSLAPELPAHPAQAYEGIATLGLALALIAVGAAQASAARGGPLLLVALGGWAAIRAVVSLTWRDPAVVGPLGASGALAAAIALLAVVGSIVLALRARGGPTATAAGATGGPAWPDPESRPRF